MNPNRSGSAPDSVSDDVEPGFIWRMFSVSFSVQTGFIWRRFKLDAVPRRSIANQAVAEANETGNRFLWFAI